jgi:hypothetical protein
LKRTPPIEPVSCPCDSPTVSATDRPGTSRGGATGSSTFAPRDVDEDPRVGERVAHVADGRAADDHVQPVEPRPQRRLEGDGARTAEPVPARSDAPRSLHASTYASEGAAARSAGYSARKRG